MDAHAHRKKEISVSILRKPLHRLSLASAVECDYHNHHTPTCTLLPDSRAGRWVDECINFAFIRRWSCLSAPVCTADEDVSHDISLALLLGAYIFVSEQLHVFMGFKRVRSLRSCSH